MSRKMPSKDDALEALDFIVSVLKEHEKDMGRLIKQLGNVTEKMGATGELSARIEKVERARQKPRKMHGVTGEGRLC